MAVRRRPVANLQGFNAHELTLAHAAGSALLAFAEHTQGRALAHVRSLRVQRASELMDLPPATQRNLELVQTLRGESSPTLFSLLDTCKSGMGSRMLRQWLLHPKRERGEAMARHDAIAALHQEGFEPLREALKSVSDVERIAARIALRQVRPRELTGLRATLQALPALRAATPAALRDAAVNPPADILELLERAIAAEPALLPRDGGVIADGFDAELDELRGIQQNCDGFLLDLETRERSRTGIANLRVQFNRVHGFYIEVTQGQVDKVPMDYQRRQTLKNAERYITPELKAFEDKALSANERALSREKLLYEQVIDALISRLQPLTALGRTLASLDALAALAER
jgi:DNA mismatch repair protein MutS